MNESVLVAARRRDLLAIVAAMLRQPLFANAAYLIGVNIVGSLVGFAFWGLAARLYHPEDVGIASAVLSAIVLVSGIAGLGIGTGLVCFLPKSPSPRRLLNTALTFCAGAALVVGGVFLAGLSVWSPSLVILQRNYLCAAGFLSYTTATTLGTIVQMAFVARRHAGYALIHTCIINGVRVLLVAVLVGLGAAGIVGSIALAAVLALILSISQFLPRIEPGYRPRPDLSWSELTSIVPYSVGNYVAAVLTQTSQMLLPLITLEMLGPTYSGHAYIAWMLGSLLTSPGIAIADSAFAEGSNSPDKLPNILIRASALGLLLTVPTAMVLGVGAPWVLLLFGPSYSQEAAGLLRWLAAAAPVAVLTRLYFTHLRVQKQIGRLILPSGTVAAATLGVAVALMPRFGIAASGVGWLVGNGLVVILAFRDVWGKLSRREPK